MSEQEKGADRPVPAVVKTRRVNWKLNEIAERRVFRRRDPNEFEGDAFEKLVESIRTEGLIDPLKGLIEPGGANVLVSGYLRLHALRALAGRGVAGFTPDMDVPVDELVDATTEDALVLSVHVNVRRKTLSQVQRAILAKDMYDLKIPKERAADALEVSARTYERDVRVGGEPWLLDLVSADCVGITVARHLLEAAQKAGTAGELRKFLEGWVAETRKEIGEQAARAKAAGKQLTPAEPQVKSRLTPELANHWLAQLADKQPLDTEVRRCFVAQVDPESLTLQVQAVTADLRTIPLEDGARLIAQLSKVVQDSMPLLVQRAQLEAPEGPQAKLRESKSVYDPTILAALGYPHLAEQPPAPGVADDAGGDGSTFEVG